MKTIRVEEVYRLHGTASASLPEDVPLKEVIARFAREPGLRAVFLIDAEQRFAGVVTRIAIMKWAHFQLFGRWRTEISASATSQVVDPEAIDGVGNAWNRFNITRYATHRNPMRTAED